MRKVNLIVLTILLCFVIQAAAVCPAPFEKIKQISLKTPYRGAFMATFTINKNGQEIVYLMGYLPHRGEIGIGKACGSNAAIYIYNENTNQYSIITNGEPQRPVDGKTCILKAYEIFREMVADELI